jgi:cytochrome oxidase Cu insertion factor (SCO1/SenC/PrrC family)
MMRRQDVWPLAAIGFVLAVTAGWWGFALWSVPGAPAWLERARSVCFNITESGLPDTKGWLLLLGQPPIMVGFLLVGWRDSVAESLRRLLATGWGRAAVGVTLALGLTGVGLTAARVADARLPEVAWGAEGPAALTHPRIDRAWPEAEGLVDQTGATFSVERLRGRPALVTFAFGHCETLCPLVVEQARAARSELDRRGEEVSLVVFTLDPWRDTPGRLPAIHAAWQLHPEHDFLVGGPVDAVEAGLDAWDISRTRDLRTGDVLHPGVIYLVDSDGTVAYASTGGVEHVVSLFDRLGMASMP